MSFVVLSFARHQPQRAQSYTKRLFTVPILNLCPAHFILMIKDANQDDKSPTEQIRNFLLDHAHAPFESLINCLMWGISSVFTS